MEFGFGFDIWTAIKLVSLAYAVFALIRHRKSIVKNLKRLPIWARIVFGLLLALCALIPGPVDDFIVVGIIVKLGKE